MTLAELNEIIQDMMREYPEDTEVRIATQPNWPLRFHVDRVKFSDDMVWIATSHGHPYDENPYADKGLWDEE